MLLKEPGKIDSKQFVACWGQSPQLHGYTVEGSHPRNHRQVYITTRYAVVNPRQTGRAIIDLRHLGISDEAALGICTNRREA